MASDKPTNGWDTISTQHFMEVCQRSFHFLIDDFNFKPIPLPEGKFVNKFQYRLSNGTITVVILGEGYGTVASVTLFDNRGRQAGVNRLVPGFNPSAKYKRKKETKSQDEQIEDAANKLRLHGQDVLSGDLTRFDQISYNIDELMAKINQGTK